MPNQRYQEVLRGIMRYQEASRCKEKYEGVSSGIKRNQKVSCVSRDVKSIKDNKSIINGINNKIRLVREMLSTCQGHVRDMVETW